MAFGSRCCKLLHCKLLQCTLLKECCLAWQVALAMHLALLQKEIWEALCPWNAYAWHFALECIWMALWPCMACWRPRIWEALCPWNAYAWHFALECIWMALWPCMACWRPFFSLVLVSGASSPHSNCLKMLDSKQQILLNASKQNSAPSYSTWVHCCATLDILNQTHNIACKGPLSGGLFL